MIKITRSELFRLIFSAILIFFGGFSLLSVFNIKTTGIAGEFFFKSFLLPVFGHSAFVFGLYLLFVALLLVVFKKASQKIFALTIFFFPLIMIINSIFSTQPYPGGYFGTTVKDTIVEMIGNNGLYLFETVLIFFSILILFLEEKYQSDTEKISDSPGKSGKYKGKLSAVDEFIRLKQTEKRLEL